MLDLENDETIVRPATEILENCVNALEKRSGYSEFHLISSFSNLPPVTEEVSEMQACMSKNKGASYIWWIQW